MSCTALARGGVPEMNSGLGAAYVFAPQAPAPAPIPASHSGYSLGYSRLWVPHL